MFSHLLLFSVSSALQFAVAAGTTVTSYSIQTWGTYYTETSVYIYATPYPLLYVNGGLVDCDNLETKALSTWSASDLETTSYPYVPYTTDVYTSFTTTAVPKIETLYTPTLRLNLLPGDIEICDYKNANPSPFDAQSNSLEGICQLVAEYPRCFISLEPTIAAYMPTWVAYLIQFLLVTRISALSRLAERDLSTQPRIEGEATQTAAASKPPGFLSTALGLVGAVLSIVRTGYAVYLLLEFRKSWNKLPFLSPVLWIDWLEMWAFIQRWSENLSIIPMAIGLTIYAMCFWLCVGYGSLGYGVYQYDVLDVPPACLELGAGFQDTQTAFQTDPRRHYFVVLHVLSFAVSSFAFITAWSYRGQGWGRKAVIGLLILISLPNFIGIIMAAAVNGHAYLVLNPRRYCFASYVSGRAGYLDLYWASWKVKLANLLGVHV